jgi:hypothetical protein
MQSVSDTSPAECSAYSVDKQGVYKRGALDTSLNCGVFRFEKEEDKNQM